VADCAEKLEGATNISPGYDRGDNVNVFAYLRRE
jgi:hypothetical protein